MIAFKQGTRGYIPKDLQQIKRATGGKVGTISIGSIRVPEVLMLEPNLFVTDRPVPPMVKRIAEMEQVDIHVVKNQGEVAGFISRWRAFDAKKG